MTSIEVSSIRGKLEAMVAELDRSARRRDTIAIESSAESIESAIMATEREFAVRSIEVASKRLCEVRAALKRIDQRTFGICLECEEPISKARINAVPWSPLCLQCQSENDCQCAPRGARFTLPLAA